MRPANPEEARQKKAQREAVKWYKDHQLLYAELSSKVELILKEACVSANLIVHTITNRAKTSDSFKRKAAKYEDPQREVHDLAGVRVITYVDSQVPRVAALVKNMFSIDDKNSVDKTAQLGTSTVGYRSVHFVAELPKERTALIEYQRFAGMRFELQIRSILQHAWAEIEHDRGYKASRVMPDVYRRRFALLAGALELLDNEFDRLSQEIDARSSGLKLPETLRTAKIECGVLGEYMAWRFGKFISEGLLEPDYGNSEDGEEDIAGELRKFRIHTIRELDRIAPKKLDKDLRKHLPTEMMGAGNFLSLLRDLMIIKDARRYFGEVWRRKWTGVTPANVEFWKRYFHDIEALLESLGIKAEVDF